MGKHQPTADEFKKGILSDEHKIKIKSSENGTRQDERPVRLDEFYAYAPENKFIFVPTRELWPPSSVDSRIDKIGSGTYTKKGKEITQSATEWLSQNQSVEQMTWAPGLPMLIENRLVANGGIIDYPGCRTFNMYQAPTIDQGDPEKASQWIDHIKRVYPDHSKHLLNWFAHRVQYPGKKINHALVLGGGQGIGKDTILEPVRRAVGPWNFNDVTPAQLIGRFNGFVKSVILRVSEARDMGDVDRYGFYEHMKIYTAAPPDVLRCDEKNRREYGVLNICGVVITTNHKAGGIYIPSDDRRHFVAWSEANKDDFTESYWNNIWDWYDREGYGHVAAYLQTRNIVSFDPKAPPTKTDAFWEIVDAGRAPEDAELADALDKLENPDAVTIDMVAETAEPDFKEWLNDRRNRRQVPHRFETAGYVPVRNDAAKDGLWVVSGKRMVVYAKKQLSKRDRITVVNELVKEARYKF